MRFTHRYLAIAALACASAFTACVSVTRSVFNFAKATLFGAVEAFATPQVGVVAGALPAEKHQACAYALKQAKRDRPTIAPGMWRMCPSC